MDLIKWDNPAPMDLWEAFDGLHGELDRALDPFRIPSVSGLLDRTSAPAVDVLETEDEYLVIADLPGVDKRDLEVSVSGTLLSIKGEKKGDPDSEKSKVFRKEIWIGSFCRTIDLPAPVDAGKIAAELKDGVLTVHIAKRKEAKAKLIPAEAK
jgi:HSP20 family protein